MVKIAAIGKKNQTTTTKTERNLNSMFEDSLESRSDYFTEKGK